MGTADPSDQENVMTNLATNLMTTADRDPDAVAIRLDALALTWANLRDQALATAGALQAAGLQPGDRVALILPNVPAYPILFYGTLLAGGTVVP
jgi:long-chain acyl-CoA synthetase